MKKKHEETSEWVHANFSNKQINGYNRRAKNEKREGTSRAKTPSFRLPFAAR